MPRDRNRTRNLSAEDEALFAKAMRDVVADPAKRKPPPRAEKKTRAVVPKSPPPPIQKPPIVQKSQPPLAAGQSGDVDARTMERLRRGQLRPEARLDLHGMTQAEAHAALTGFIGDAAGQGARTVIIITGKGRVSQGGGVLRNQFPGWINSPAIRPAVIGFAEAQPRDGGSGAFYVLLRRRRDFKG